MANQKVGVVDLKQLRDFLKDKNEKDLDLLCGFQKSNEFGKNAFGKKVSEIVTGIPDEPGVYLWVKYDETKKTSEPVYIGMTRKKKTSLKKRIREELVDERIFLWLDLWTQDQALKCENTYYKGKYKKNWERSFAKAGTTHIIWFSSSMMLYPEKIKSKNIENIEAILIVELDPSANQPTGSQEDKTRAHAIEEKIRLIVDNGLKVPPTLQSV
jgi:hypothetical protein